MKVPSASFGSSEVYQNVHSLPPDPRTKRGRPQDALSGWVVLLETQLPGRFAAAPGCFLARQVANAEVGGVDQKPPPVDQNLRLTRGRLDHRRTLQHGRHPDAPAVDLGLEVGEDLVVLVHRNAVQPDQLSAAGRLLGCGFSVGIHAHMPNTRSRAPPNPNPATEVDTPGRYRTGPELAVPNGAQPPGRSLPRSWRTGVRTVSILDTERSIFPKGPRSRS